MKTRSFGPWPPSVVVAVMFVASGLLAGKPVAAADISAPNYADRTWGFGWDNGLTLRRWLGQHWELALAAGPDDFLAKAEKQAWLQSDPLLQHGALQVPTDVRQEQGWVRTQAGYLISRRQSLSLVAYAGLEYNWTDYQERSLVLDPLVGEYDTWELDRFTERWVLSLGLRPSWRPYDFLTIEWALGLAYSWDDWDQTTIRTYAGVSGADRTITDGDSSWFQDFGWEGATSLQFFFWF